MNNIKTYTDFLFEFKSERAIVQDLARHLSFDKDIIKYLNTSRAKRGIGWREMLDSKLHGKNKDYINYITKNMVADYNPQITGYIQIDDGDGEDFDSRHKRRGKFQDMSLEDQIDDLNNRTEDIEYVLGIDPDDQESIDNVEQALKDAGYEKPEIEDKRERDDDESSDETGEDKPENDEEE